MADCESEPQCDGKQPSCSSCERTKSECQYAASYGKSVLERKVYIKALEDRIAELESSLSYDGKEGVADDHWERLRPREDSFNELSQAIRELSLNASGYYVGATTQIALGRMLDIALQGDRQSKLQL